MWCRAKYFFNHSCVKSQLYHILVENPTPNETEVEEFLDCVDYMEDLENTHKEEENMPTISLHAMLGTTGYHTMRIQGRIKNQRVIFLVDTGSTHNFMDHVIIKRIGGISHSISSLTVTVANGEQLRAKELCPRLLWEVQGVTQSIDFLVLPLIGCDAVLGIQWLITLGLVLWNFQDLSMQFDWQG